MKSIESKERGVRFHCFPLIVFMMGLFVMPGHALNCETQERTRIERWAEDIDQIAEELPQRHKDLFHIGSEVDFRNNIKALKDSLPDRNDEEIVFALSRIVASFGDSHTGLGFRPKIAFPLSLYWFKEGIFCVQAFPEYREALNCRLLEIEGQPIADIIQILATAIPHENRSQLMKSTPGYLVFAEMLYGAGIIADPAKTVYTFEDMRGERFEIEMPSVSMQAGIRPVSGTGPGTPLPLYRKHQKSIYDFEYLPEHKTLYVVYNSCRERLDKPFAQFLKEVFEAVDQNTVDRFVIDLRRNGGGNSSIFESMIPELVKRTDINQNDRFFVIVGRGTFSSAVLNAIQLKNRTQATFVGEPSGGKPNHFGEVKMFLLKNSKLPVTYSTKYFAMAKQDTDAVYPDISVELSIADFNSHRDPVMERILSAGNEEK